jgi:hypothetical protein
MQTPFTMCNPGPQALRTLMNMSVGAYSGADDTKAKANTTTIHLIMASPPVDDSVPLCHSTRPAVTVR